MKRVALTAALFALIAGTAQAAPGDYSITYNWNPGGDGFVGWGQQEIPEPGTPGFQSPYYAARLAPPELRLTTSPASDGTADRTYPFVEPPVAGPRRLATVQAPGTTRIRSATFDQIDFLRTSNERQFLRLAVYGDTPPGATNVFDFRTDSPAPGPFNNDVTYNNVGPITVNPSDPGRSAQVWLFTSCDPSCPFVQFGPGGAPRSYGNVGRVSLDLFDPEPPALAASGPLLDGAWTNSRDVRAAAVSASDPGSGMRSVTVVRRRTGGSSVTVLNQPAGCNATHTAQIGGTGREAAPCPDAEGAGFSQPLGALPDGEYTYTVTATDDSARTTSNAYGVRLDRTRPGTVTGTGPLRALLSRWTNRTDRVSLLVRGRDSRSGIQRLEVVADMDGGTERVVGASDLACGTSCPTSYAANLFTDLGTLPDGRVGISVRAIDAAGNVKESRVGTLLLDRVAPLAPAVVVRTSSTGTTLTVSPQADPSPGSGVRGFEATVGIRTFRSSGRSARIPGRFDGTVPVRSFDRAGNTGAAFAAGTGLISCREALEGRALTRPAKIGEVRAGRDTQGVLTYGEGGEKTLELAGSLTVKGVGIGLSESYTHSEGIEMSKISPAGQGYNVFVNLNLKAERLQRFVNGKRDGYCKRTVGPKKVYRVVETASKAISAPKMPQWQRGRADCNNAGRWRGQRIVLDPDTRYTKNQNNKITYKRGLSVLGVGFNTSNTWSHSSSITYTWGHRYKRYWLCGDGGGRDSAGTPNPKTWINLFAGADPTS